MRQNEWTAGGSRRAGWGVLCDEAAAARAGHGEARARRGGVLRREGRPCPARGALFSLPPVPAGVGEARRARSTTQEAPSACHAPRRPGCRYHSSSLADASRAWRRRRAGQKHEFSSSSHLDLRVRRAERINVRRVRCGPRQLDGLADAVGVDLNREGWRRERDEQAKKRWPAASNASPFSYLHPLRLQRGVRLHGPVHVAGTHHGESEGWHGV